MPQHKKNHIQTQERSLKTQQSVMRGKKLDENYNQNT